MGARAKESMFSEAYQHDTVATTVIIFIIIKKNGEVEVELGVVWWRKKR